MCLLHVNWPPNIDEFVCNQSFSESSLQKYVDDGAFGLWIDMQGAFPCKRRLLVVNQSQTDLCLGQEAERLQLHRISPSSFKKTKTVPFFQTPNETKKRTCAVQHVCLVILGPGGTANPANGTIFVVPRNAYSQKLSCHHASALGCHVLCWVPFFQRRSLTDSEMNTDIGCYSCQLCELVACLAVGWLAAGWLAAGWLAAGSVGCLLVGWLVVWLFDWRVSWLVGWQAGQFVGSLLGWFFWLVGWFVLLQLVLEYLFDFLISIVSSLLAEVLILQLRWVEIKAITVSFFCHQHFCNLWCYLRVAKLMVPFVAERLKQVGHRTPKGVSSANCKSGGAGIVVYAIFWQQRVNGLWSFCSARCAGPIVQQTLGWCWTLQGMATGQDGVNFWCVRALKFTSVGGGAWHWVFRCSPLVQPPDFNGRTTLFACWNLDDHPVPRTALDCVLDPGVRPFEDPVGLLKATSCKILLQCFSWKMVRFWLCFIFMPSWTENQNHISKKPQTKSKTNPLQKQKLLCHLSVAEYFRCQIAFPTALLVAPGAAAWCSEPWLKRTRHRKSYATI